LLKTDWIAHKVVPVSNYQELSAAGKDLLATHEDVRSIILINCGGVINLMDVFPDLRSNQHVYVLESRRPLNLDNLFGNELVSIIDDGHVESELELIREAYETTAYSEDEEDESNSQIADEAGVSDNDELLDVEMEADLEEDGEPSEMNPERSSSPMASADEIPELANLDRVSTDEHRSLTTTGRKRSFPNNEGRMPSHKKRKRRRLQSLLYTYYTQGTWYGDPVSISMFQLVTQLGRVSVELSWCAILGLSHQFLAGFISEVCYSDFLLDMQAQVMRLSKDADPSMGELVHEVDYKLELYRHWNLYDSMQYSKEVACRLSSWTEKGQSRLRYLLTKMGIPKEEYSKPFLHMDKLLKEEMFPQMIEHGPHVGLDHITRKLFVRKCRLGPALSAADAVASLKALSVFPNISHLVNQMGLQLDIYAQFSDPQQWHSMSPNISSEDAFFAVLDAISEETLLYSGIHAAKLVSTTLVTLSGSLISQRCIKTMKGFRYVILHSGMDVSPALLSNYGIIRELALILFGALREINKTELPLIIASPLQGQSDLFLLVGYIGAATEGLVRRNPVGIAFEKTANDTQARTRHNFFDSANIEVAREDLSEFLEQLQVNLVLK
jgi:cell division control protein 45